MATLPARGAPSTRQGVRHLTRLVTIALLSLALLGSSCGTDDTVRPPVRIAAAGGSEQQVMAALIAEALAQQDIPAQVQTEPGDTLDARAAVRSGIADLYVDYTGSAWTRALGRSQPLARPGDSFEAVQAADESNGLIWLAPTRANATLAMFVRSADRPPGDEGTMTWLAGALASAGAGLCADEAFLNRPSGLEVLAETYAISTDLLVTKPMEEDEALPAVAEGRCFAGLGTATSGLARTLGLAPVVDDQRVFPAFVVAPVMRESARADQPDVRRVLNDVMPGITTEVLAQMNAAVDGGADPSEVARLHLQQA